MYKCVKPFVVSRYDDGGFNTEDDKIIDEGTLWEKDESGTNLIGGEIRLENPESLEWLEISKNCMERHFVELKEMEVTS